MGFDVSGLKPKVNVGMVEFENYHAIESLEYQERWSLLDSLTDKERDTYYAELEEYLEVNTGMYFRNNVWWWRPLWNYTCMICEDIMTADDMGGGNFNDGYTIKKTKALKMGRLLDKSIKSGEAQDYSEKIKKDNHKRSKSDNKDTRFLSNYPFEVDNVKRFARFLKQSGGIVIC